MSKLVKVRHLSHRSDAPKHTVPCLHRNCGTCRLILKDSSCVTANGDTVYSAPGDCDSYNVVYLFLCRKCSKIYIGRTVQYLRERVNDHRGYYYSLLTNPELYETDNGEDSYSLGYHIMHDHGCSSREDFNNMYFVFILKNCSPTNLEINEHRLIHVHRSLKPLGINAVDPLGIPLLEF